MQENYFGWGVSAFWASFRVIISVIGFSGDGMNPQRS
jgi:hypothetical protein